MPPVQELSLAQPRELFYVIFDGLHQKTQEALLSSKPVKGFSTELRLFHSS